MIGVVIRLALAPWTTTPHDVAVWYAETARGFLGVPLYSKTGFTYPPVWAYPLRAIGAAARWIGLAPGDLASHQNAFNALTAQLHPLSAPYITTPGYNLTYKLILFAFDLGAAWLVWRGTLRLTNKVVLARRAFILWWLSPVVLFESAVHGAFDVMVAFFVLAALVARMERRYAVCGAAVALGILTKVAPVFLVPLIVVATVVPLPGEPPKTARRQLADLGRLAAGALGASVVILLPVALGGHFASMVNQVTIRTGGASGAGGVGLFGMVNATALSSFASWTQSHGSLITHADTAIDALVAIGAAAAWPWISKRFSLHGLVFVAAAVLAVPVFIQGKAQPQYVIWFWPLLCMLAAPWRWPKVALWTAGAGCALFEIAVLGPLGFLSPLAISTSVLSVHSVVRSTQWLDTTAGTIGANRSGDLEFIAWALITISMLVLWTSLVRHLWRQRRQAGAGAAPSANGARRRIRRPVSAPVLGVASAFLVLALVVAGLGELGTSTALAVGAPTTAASSASVRTRVVHSPGPVRVMTYAAAAPASFPHLYVYQDNRFPTAGSTPAKMATLVRDLKDEVAHRQGTVATINAQTLGLVLADTTSAPHSALVLATGTLPNTVWSPHTNLVAPWIQAGGEVIWAGAPPGMYSVAPSPQIVKTPAVTVPIKGRTPVTTTQFGCGPLPKSAVRQVKPAVLFPGTTIMTAGHSGTLLGLPFALPQIEPHGSGGCMGIRPTSLARALQIGYPDETYAPTLAEIAQVHGLALGYLHHTQCSVSWLPSGGGGTVLFSGRLSPTIVSSDVFQILGSGITRTLTQASWTTLDPGQSSRLTVPAVPPTAHVMVVTGFEPSLNGDFFQRTNKALPR